MNYLGLLMSYTLAAGVMFLGMLISALLFCRVKNNRLRVVLTAIIGGGIGIIIPTLVLGHIFSLPVLSVVAIYFSHKLWNQLTIT